MSYSVDLRERVLKFIEKGGTKTMAVQVFGVGRATIYEWINKREKRGTLEDPPPKRPWKKIDPQKLLSLVQTSPDLELSDYAKEFNVSPAAVAKAMKKLKITRKKRPYSTKSVTKTSAKYFWKT